MSGGCLAPTAWRVLRLRIEEMASRYEAQLRIYGIRRRGEQTRGSAPSSVFGMGLTTPRHKIKFVTKYHKGPRIWTDSLDKRPKLRKMEVQFGVWNVRSLYRAGSLITVAKEVSKCKLDLMGVN
jgi:hypothetical protein